MENQRERYLVAVDAGATKTHYVLYDREKDSLRRVTGGPANHEVLNGGFAELRELLACQFALLLDPMGLAPGDIAGAALGMGGVDTPRQHEIISGFLRELGFSRFALANDASLGIKAESSTGTGLCAVNGSGFSIFGMDGEGNTVQIGGFGDMSGDLGGGSYYAGQVMSAVYGAIFKGEPDTALRPAVLGLFGVEDPKRLMEVVSIQMDSEQKPALRRDLCRALFRAAGNGDLQARRIFDQSAEAYAGAIRGAVRELPRLAEGLIEVTLVGSVFTKGEDPYLIQRLDRLLNPAERRFALKPIASDPVAGALYWAHEVAGWRPGNDTRVHCQQLVQAC